MNTLTPRQIEIANSILESGIRFTKSHCKGIGLSYPTGKRMKMVAVQNLLHMNCVPDVLRPFFQPYIDAYK